MEKKPNKKYKTFTSIIVVLLVLITIALTYAYFTLEIKGNDEAKSIKANSGKLIIDFENTEYINNENGNLIKDEERETKADVNKFSVKHNSLSKGSAKYTLTLEDIDISENLKSADFKWELLKNGTVINSGDFKDIGTQTSLILTSSLQNLEQNQIDNYIFRIWLSETSLDQSNLFNGSFTAKIALSAKSA